MSSSSLRLHTLVLLPILLLCATITGVVGYWSYQSELDAAQEMGMELNRRLAHEVGSQLDSLLATPAQLLEANRLRVRDRLEAGSSLEELQRSFVDQVRAFPNLTNLAFGGADGRYACAYRLWDDPSQVMVSLAGPDGTMNSYRVDAGRRPANRLFSEPDFQVTQRPWYRAAALTEEAVWFPPYSFFSGQTLAIGMARSIRDDDGNVLGVLAADIAFQELGRHLASLELKEHGHAFVVEPNGYLVADSSGRTTLRRSGSGPLRVRAENSHVEAIRLASAAALRELVPGGPDRFSTLIESESGPYLVHAFRHLRPGGLELLVGIAVPREAYLRPLTAGMQRRFLLAGLVLLLGLGLAYRVARTIARPVETLSAATQRVAEGQAIDDTPRSRVAELDRLSLAFSTMAHRLKSTLDSLEHRVEERTAELEAANERLRVLSRTDQLTGVTNRRGLDEALEQEWRASRGSGKPITLMLCDLDWFKEYNDEYGHLDGDKALRRVARSLQSLARDGRDVLARMGGEEFVFLLPDLSREEAAGFADSARRAILDLDLSHRGSAYERISLSIGVVTAVAPAEESDDGNPVDELLRRADEALYRAKRRGRNRVEVAWHQGGEPGGQR